MKTILKFLKFSLLIFIISLFSSTTVNASSDFKLEKMNECDMKYMGESCVIKMKVTNNTEEILDGEGILKVKYNETLFDGEGIYPNFLAEEGSDNWLSPSDWSNGQVTFSNFDIKEGESFVFLKLRTHLALIPGQYSFEFTLNGTTEKGETNSAVVLLTTFSSNSSSATSTNPISGMVTDTGGVIVLDNPDGSQIKVIVPSGAVSQNTVIYIERIEDINGIEPGNGLMMISGNAYEITAFTNGIPVTQFNSPITIVFTYTNGQSLGINESSLKFYYWDVDNNQWIVVDNNLVNENDNTVSITINHLTIFSLMGETLENENNRPEGLIERIVSALRGDSEEETPETEEVKETEEPSSEDNQFKLGASLISIWNKIPTPVIWITLILLIVLIILKIIFKKRKLFKRKNK